VTALAAGSAFLGVLLLAIPRRMVTSDGIGRYLRPHRPDPAPARRDAIRRFQAGLSWSWTDHQVRRIGAAALGMGLGSILGSGGLLPGVPVSRLPLLAVSGAAAGLLGLRAWVTNRIDRRRRRLGQELPAVADMLALGVLSGASVASAIEAFLDRSAGVAADELGWALRRHRDGVSLGTALTTLTRRSVSPEAGRLYTTLANAHETGGPLGRALAELATDFRASIARGLIAEGGKRAVAIYAPILALMIPVALLFLMYPTVVGLRELAGTP
jgi:tight adherence protein C